MMWLQVYETCLMCKLNDVTKDQVKLQLFGFSLRGRAKDWLQCLPNGTIHTRKELEENFLEIFSHMISGVYTTYYVSLAVFIILSFLVLFRFYELLVCSCYFWIIRGCQTKLKWRNHESCKKEVIPYKKPEANTVDVFVLSFYVLSCCIFSLPCKSIQAL